MHSDRLDFSSPAILGDRGLDLQLVVACSVGPGSHVL